MMNSNRKVEMGFESQTQYDTFKKDYDKAKEEGLEIFSSSIGTFTVGYAKYLIEYIDDECKQRKGLVG